MGFTAFGAGALPAFLLVVLFGQDHAVTIIRVGIWVVPTLAVLALILLNNREGNNQ